jgi:hypothetical protein
MKAILSASLALALCAAGSGHAAEPQDSHKGHHPAPATVGSQSPSAPSAASAAGPVPAVASGSPVERKSVDTQLARMREMHARMAKATTPTERHALMAEHMHVMQDGMEMMQKMSMPHVAGDDAARGTAPGGRHDSMGAKMQVRHDAMHQRMQMMEAMMQMMMDRLEDPPAHR